MPQLIQINRADNVAITLQALRKGEQASLGERVFTAQGDIPADHKLALSPIACGEKIIKYGMPIGIATADIRPGDHVHSHNMRSGLSGLLGYTYQPCASAPAVATEGLGCTFWGYRRKNGRVGTRNQVWIIPTVSCVNDLVDRALLGCATAFWPCPITGAAPSWGMILLPPSICCGDWSCTPMRAACCW